MSGVDASGSFHSNFLMGLEELCASLHLAPPSFPSTVEWRVLSKIRRKQERRTERDSTNYSLMSIGFIVFPRY